MSGTDAPAGLASEDGPVASVAPASVEPPRLFPDQPEEEPAAPAPDTASRPVARNPKRGARLREANRGQVVWGRIDLEAQLPDEHVARAIWAVLERLDLSALYAPIAARDDVAGAPAIDPKILLALWVFAAPRARAVAGASPSSASATRRTGGSAAASPSTTTR